VEYTRSPLGIGRLAALGNFAVPEWVFPQSLNCQFTYPVNLFGGGDYTGAQVNGQLDRSYRIISRDKSSSC
jgi:hypothetical protein